MNKKMLFLTVIELLCGSSAYGNTLPDPYLLTCSANHKPTQLPINQNTPRQSTNNHGAHQEETHSFPNLSHTDCFPQYTLSTDAFFQGPLQPHNKTACSFLQEKTYENSEHICLFNNRLICLNKNRFLSTSTSMVAGGLLVTLTKQANNILQYSPLVGKMIAEAPAEWAALGSTLLVLNQCLDIYGEDYLPAKLYTPIHKYKAAIIQLGQCVDLECDIETREFIGGILKKAFLGTMIAKSMAFTSNLIPINAVGASNHFAKRAGIILFNMAIGMVASQIVYSFEAIKKIDEFIPSYILTSIEYN